ncbi:MAG: OmpA family protein [Mangrovibacterium sp.]
MKNFKTQLVFLFLILLSASLQGQSKKEQKTIDKALQGGNFQALIALKGEINPADIANYLRNLGKMALENGDYEKSVNYFSQSFHLLKTNISEQDICDYYYALLKCNKEEDLLQDSFALPYAKSLKVIQLIENAKSRCFYRQVEVPFVQTKSMDINGLLFRYGFSFHDYFIYFANQGELNADENLWENKVYAERVSKRTHLAKVRYIPEGAIGSEGSTPLKMKEFGRVVTLCKGANNEVDFFTVVPENGKPEQIKIKGGHFPSFSYNSDEYACAMPFFDVKKNRLYFSSTMRGGHGGWDIYYSDFNGSIWEKPVNLGNKLNSPYDELFPFSKDSLLYFSSDGWEGFGGFENYVFNEKSRRCCNLAFANSVDDDYCFQLIDEQHFHAIGIKGKQSIYYSFEDTYDELLLSLYDKFSTDTPIVQTATPVQSVSTPVQSVSTPVQATTTATVQSVSTPVQTTTATPVQSVSTPVQTTTTAAVQSVSTPVQTATATVQSVSTPVQTATLPLIMKASGQNSKQMENVLFDVNSQIIDPEYYVTLNRAVDQIIASAAEHIIVWGHTDKTGHENYNNYLSYMRALNVVDYLKKGLGTTHMPQFHIVIGGAGYAKGSAAGDSNDRKVEIRQGMRNLPYPMMYAYKAEAGETLADVAELFQNDLELLQQLNETTVIPEDRLVLVGIQGMHLVKYGENFYRISLNYNLPLSVLQKANKKPNMNAIVGDKWFIPLSKSSKK